MASDKGKWLQSELLKLPTAELVSLSSWLQEVVKARSALEQLEAPFAQEAKPAEVKPEPSPPMEKPAAPTVRASTAPAAAPAPAVPTPAAPLAPPPVAPVAPVAPAPVPAPVAPAPVAVAPVAVAPAETAKLTAPAATATPAVQAPAAPVAATPGTSRERSRSRSTKRQAPVAAPQAAAKADQSEPKLVAEPKVDPISAACNGHAAPKGPEPVANGPGISKPDIAPPSKLAAEAATVKDTEDGRPATPAEPSAEKPTQPEETPATRSSLALNADHSELMSSLWSAFGTANSCRSKVTQAEQNLCGMQSQLQMAMQKAEEAFVAVQHWTGMVEQTKMEQMTFANMCYDPTMQAQAQQRVATAMQSHAFAQQSGERAMQQRQSAEVALQNAQSVLMTEQAEMKKAGHELKEVVKRAEAFLKENSNALPQDKVQPLGALCTRFMSFAQQLGAQEDAMPGSMQQAMPKAAAQTPAPGVALHPLADYQQRVMILEEQKTDENQMDELFASQEEDVTMANFSPCGGNVAATGSGGPVAPGAVAPTGKDQLAAYKNRLMEEASYLQAVFGGKKPDGTPDPGAGPCGNVVA